MNDPKSQEQRITAEVVGILDNRRAAAANEAVRLIQSEHERAKAASREIMKRVALAFSGA